MIAAIDILQFRAENIYMCKPIKNKIMAGGMFSRIIYSSESSSMNGIYMAFDLSGHICEIFPSKFKIQFTPASDGVSKSSSEHTSDVIRSLCDMERSILGTISIPGKTPLYKITSNSSGCLIICLDHPLLYPAQLMCPNTKTDMELTIMPDLY
jgi:hypothetical protein